MAGYKKRQWVKKQTPPNSDINVTPLVDVVLVLLIIFMVLTPLLEKDIEVRVPETEVENEPQPQNDQLVVSLTEAGAIKINAETMPSQEEYVSRLKRILAAKARDERVVFFMAEDKANYGSLIVLMDGAKTAGAVVLGMATEDLPPGAMIPGGGGEGGVPAPEMPPVPQ